MGMLLLLFSSSALAIFIIFLLAKSRPATSRRPPGPKGLPFIGNLHQVDIPKLHIWLTKLSTNLKLFRLPFLVISSADAAEKALKLNDIAFAGRPCTFASLRFSYDQSYIITTSYSDYWREMRKVVVHHLFSPQKIRSFRPIREDEVCAMIAGISNKANSNEVIDIGDTVSSFNSSVLCRVAFGKKLDRCTHSEKNISQLLAVLVETFLADCAVFGWVYKLCGAAPRVEKIFEDMDSFYQQLIDEHLNPDRPDSMTNDILDLLIQLREDHFLCHSN